MAVRTERVWWIAPLLAAALVLHLFMLIGVPERPSGERTAHGDNSTAAPLHLPTTGHDDPPAPHTTADMLSTCFAVLALVTAGIAHIRAAHLNRSSYELDDHIERPGLRVDHATCRDGPSGQSRIAAGVLLRV